MYTLAVVLALLPPPLHWIKGYVGWIFLPTYGLYLYLVLRTSKKTSADVEEAREEAEAFDALTIAALLRRWGARVVPTRPGLWLILLQVVVSFAGIVVGARFFASFVEDVSHALGLHALLVSLILAPLATELPEAANSLIWTKQKKDVIALGNVAGAMVFQSTFPVTIGVLLTPWDLGPSSQAWPFGLMTAVFALLSGALIWLQLRIRARDNALPLSALMLGGSLYVVFIIYTLYAVLTGGTSSLSLR
jgi:Ca2+/Na+ antiporter